MTEIKHNSTEKFGIISSIKNETGLNNSIGEIVYFGKVMAFDENWKHIFFVDIGFGTIEVENNPNAVKELQIGDFVEISSVRTDLIAIIKRSKFHFQ